MAWRVIVACHCLTHDKSLRLVTVLTLRSTIDEAGLLAFWARKVDCVCKGSDVAINVRLMLSDRPWGTFFPSRSRYKCVGKLGDAVLLSVFSFPFFFSLFFFGGGWRWGRGVRGLVFPFSVWAAHELSVTTLSLSPFPFCTRDKGKGWWRIVVTTQIKQSKPIWTFSSGLHQTITV